ncbi:Mth938-like domain-containing protein [Chelativorans sp. AA-79]|uniref:Mth938-like domain-containing protein n=1 Tax=Chelativorans sp. AA-79 TaxID=3028735 RepID=UPI0023F78496|nr:Mth938-like domain-containing protein [Chelativorans sp. AA-79]WEX07318.1 Mth938-like domain-containing protein [Chelativorans sp. AA-79]
MAGGAEIRAAHFPGRAPIDAYGNGGFRFAEMSHRGSLLCLPSGIYGWEPADVESLELEDFGRAMAETSEIQILLVGTGAMLRPLPAGLREQLRGAGLSVETMSTGAAARTFNVLLAEERAVAAALIAVE